MFKLLLISLFSELIFSSKFDKFSILLIIKNSLIFWVWDWNDFNSEGFHLKDSLTNSSEEISFLISKFFVLLT